MPTKEGDAIESPMDFKQNNDPLSLRSDRIILPCMRVGSEWTIPDDILLDFWNRLVELKQVEAFFYDGSLQDWEGFITFMKNPGVFPLLIVSSDRRRFLALAWLEVFLHGMAISRSCYLGNPKSI